MKPLAALPLLLLVWIGCLVAQALVIFTVFPMIMMEDVLEPMHWAVDLTKAALS